MSASDDPSIQIIRELYRGLVRYDNDSGEPVLDLADSIESTDSVNWTIKLKDGFKFTNGEPVDADAFIRAWNYTAYGPNAEDNAYFYSKIKGIDEVSGKSPTAETLSGVKKVDDLTFTVELTAPFAAFESTLGYSGFFPVAQACLDDIDACNETPIGDGPYKMDGSWEHNAKVNLVKNTDFTGDAAGVSDELHFVIYDKVDAGYAAFQAGDLDVMYTLPPGVYADAKETYGDHLFEQASDSYSYLGFPLYNPLFQNKLVRQAISLSIDRQSIIDNVLDGLPVAAQGAVSPNFPGYRPGACKYCEYNPDKAKDLLAQAGGWPAGAKLELWANAGAGHDEWLKAAGDQIQKVLGIPYELKISLDFGPYLDTADAKGFDGPFRLGWGPDYPVLETYLGPLYVTGASSNYEGYSNTAFDDAVAAGNAADNADDAIKNYQDAEDIILEDLPAVPLWFGRYTVVYGDNVDLVFNKISGRPAYGQMTVK